MKDSDFLERFEAFARSKPADERYPAADTRACALAQFGFPGVALGGLRKNGVPSCAYNATVYSKPHTFGALADRLAKLRAAEVQSNV